MNRAEPIKEILEDMRDNIRDEIFSAFRAIERLGVPDAAIDRLLADQLRDILMDIFPGWRAHARRMQSLDQHHEAEECDQ